MAIGSLLTPEHIEKYNGKTSVVFLIGPGGEKVSVIGTMHIGSIEYYKAIVRECSQHDTVLYEAAAMKKLGRWHAIKHLNINTLYKKVADDITNTLSALPHPAIKDLFGKIPTQEEKTVVFQSDYIGVSDKKQFPHTTFIHADAEENAFRNAIHPFSGQNAALFLYACMVQIFIRSALFRKILIITLGRESTKKSDDNNDNALSKLSRIREGVLFHKIDEQLAHNNSFGVLYGDGHLINIVKYLYTKGCTITQIAKYQTLPDMKKLAAFIEKRPS